MHNPAIERLMLVANVLAVLAHLLHPGFVAAQGGAELTESINVFDANSAIAAALSVPRSSIQPSEVAVLVNDHDPQSVEVANYYQRVRNIPDRNMIHLNFDEDKAYRNKGISYTNFAVLKTQVDNAAGPEIQAFAMSWSKPFRIANSNYSITSAFTFGIDADHLNGNSCGAMPVNPYYGSRSTRPYSEYGIRPSMMLAGSNAASVKATIDKGLKAERTLPKGNGWFLKTADNTRSAPRDQDFQRTVQGWNRPEALTMTYSVGQSELRNTHDILFYETGLANVEAIDTNAFVPGALADDLTSLGGDLFGTLQTSALRWLEAGAAASYGTVTEPCNFAQKFPAASVLVKNYFVGNTSLEAYTKSVRWPAQGVFVGDPLARPFGTQAILVNGLLSIKTTSLEPGLRYHLYSAPSATGPFSHVAAVSVANYQFATIEVPGMSAPFYKLEAGFGPMRSETKPIATPLNGMPSKP